MSFSIDTGSGGDVSLNINGLGGTMAGRSGRVVININIDDGDGVFELLGRGLIAVERTVPTDNKQIDVKLGGGLMFAADDRVSVQAGDGLTVDPSNNLKVKLGDGLFFDSEKRITSVDSMGSLVGLGLEQGADKRINVKVGEGLQIGPNNSVQALKQVPSVEGGLEIRNGNVAVKAGTGLAVDGDGALVAVRQVPAVGSGLVVGRGGEVEVNVGEGLVVSGDGKLNAVRQVPATGPGLVVTPGGEIEVHVGEGLGVADDGALVALKQMPEIGDGLKVEDGKLAVKAGAGLEFVDGNLVAQKQMPDLGVGLVIDARGRLAVDNTVPGVDQTIRVLTDTQFSFRDSVLYIAKVFTTYTIHRSESGAVVSIDAAETSIETDAVTLSNGYGLPFGPAVPNRVADPAKPNFYKV